MKKTLSKKEARETVETFFSGKELREPAKVKKIKRLAMAYRIRLGNHRKKFCKHCLSDLRRGRVRITKHYKIITCATCKKQNRQRIVKK